MTPLEIGRPAEWAAQQKWKRRGKAMKHYGAATGLVLVGLAGIGLMLFLDGVDPTIRIVCVALIAAAVAYFAYRQHKSGEHAWTRAEHARVGVDSERTVRNTVRRQRHVAAVYGATLGKRQGDCDLVLVDPSLVVGAVEIKTGGGKVKVYGNTVKAGRKQLGGDPLGQTQKAADRLERSLNAPVLPVLCIPGMTNRPFETPHGIVVCSAKDLTAALEYFGDQAFNTPEEAQGACRELWSRHLEYSS